MRRNGLRALFMFDITYSLAQSVMSTEPFITGYAVSKRTPPSLASAARCERGAARPHHAESDAGNGDIIQPIPDLQKFATSK